MTPFLDISEFLAQTRQQLQNTNLTLLSMTASQKITRGDHYIIRLDVTGRTCVAACCVTGSSLRHCTGRLVLAPKVVVCRSWSTRSVDPPTPDRGRSATPFAAQIPQQRSMVNHQVQGKYILPHYLQQFQGAPCLSH